MRVEFRCGNKLAVILQLDAHVSTKWSVILRDCYHGVGPYRYMSISVHRGGPYRYVNFGTVMVHFGTCRFRQYYFGTSRSTISVH